MSQTQKDDGVIVAILERFEKFRLPRVLDIKAKVDGGGTLSDPDLDFLERVMKDAGEIQRLVERRPDVQPLYARAVDLYHEITAKALENEKKS
jgi:hypothetical protein